MIELPETTESQLVNLSSAYEATELSNTKLLHELRVHQIELEMQNESLQQMQIELEKSRDSYFNLYQFAPVGYLTLSNEGIITNINQTATTLLGKERIVLLNRSFFMLIADADKDRWGRHFVLVKKQDKNSSIELSLLHENSTIIHFQLDCVRNGASVHITLTDVSERKKIEQVLKERESEATLQKLVEQERAYSIEQSKFIAMLAHELKKPLATIQLSLGLIDEYPEIISTANRAIKDIQDLIQRCLQSERLKDNEVNMHIEKYNLFNKLVEIKKSISVPERLAIVAKPDLILETDGQLLYLVLFNLIDNAFKYSPPESIVRVNVGPSDSNCVVIIENEIGIAGVPDKTKVFKKYYRSKTAHHEIGSGLGLYLVKAITNLLGGEVTYSCDAKCVYFNLRLPFINQPNLRQIS
jgi:signal transduction histidine kinase